MASLLPIIFLLQLIIHLINTVGASAICELLWTLYNKLPTPTHDSVAQQRRLRSEVVRLKREMNATSSQDEFAKWAKLRRQHDRVLAEYDEKTASLKSFKESFDRTVTISRWLSTNGFRFFLQFWFAKRPLFWIPKGWVPGYVEFLLAFPRAPRGSVSIQIWGIACATTIELVGSAIVAGWSLAGKAKGKQTDAGGGKTEKKTEKKTENKKAM